MLLRNLNPKKGLCNGTRLIVKALRNNFIEAEIMSETNKGAIVNIPRIILSPSDTTLPFILRRTQFPIIPAYAITINKSQGQTFERVGIYLNEPVFTHGQLYVALSRARNQENVKIFVNDCHLQGKLICGRNDIYTQNIVYREVL
jgi:ATP-dependent DNA helicase PIF1